MVSLRVVFVAALLLLVPATAVTPLWSLPVEAGTEVNFIGTTTLAPDSQQWVFGDDVVSEFHPEYVVDEEAAVRYYIKSSSSAYSVPTSELRNVEPLQLEWTGAATVATLQQPADGRTGQEGYGAALVLTDEWLAVGTENSNEVHIYENSESGWNLFQSLHVPTQGTSTNFGESLELISSRSSTMWLFVGDSEWSPKASNLLQGKVHAYKFDGNEWELQHTFTGNSGFGHAIAYDGFHLLIGSPDENKAFLYNRDSSESSGWALNATFEGNPAQVFFGRSVDIEAPYGVIGAQGRGGAESTVIQLQDSSWHPRTTHSAQDTGDRSLIGTHLLGATSKSVVFTPALQDGRRVAGTQVQASETIAGFGDTYVTRAETGSAWELVVYRDRPSGEWSEVARIGDDKRTAMFGDAIDVSPQYFAATDRGGQVVYVYELTYTEQAPIREPIPQCESDVQQSLSGVRAFDVQHGVLALYDGNLRLFRLIDATWVEQAAFDVGNIKEPLIQVSNARIFLDDGATKLFEFDAGSFEWITTHTLDNERLVGADSIYAFVHTPSELSIRYFENDQHLARPADGTPLAVIQNRDAVGDGFVIRGGIQFGSWVVQSAYDGPGHSWQYGPNTIAMNLLGSMYADEYGVVASVGNAGTVSTKVLQVAIADSALENGQLVVKASANLAPWRVAGTEREQIMLQQDQQFAWVGVDDLGVILRQIDTCIAIWDEAQTSENQFVGRSNNDLFTEIPLEVLTVAPQQISESSETGGGATSPAGDEPTPLLPVGLLLFALVLVRRLRW